MIERFYPREETEQARRIEEKDFENEGLDGKSSGRKDKKERIKDERGNRMEKKQNESQKFQFNLWSEESPEQERKERIDHFWRLKNDDDAAKEVDEKMMKE